MKVSVIIPCYNGEEFIGQTIGSVFEQTRRVDEIIVVDDGSTDRSAEIALSFGRKVTVISKGGGGAANARNCGADHATGDALMFLDADDVLGPDVIEHLVAQLERYPDEIAACPWYRLEKTGERWIQRPPSCAKLGPDQDYLSGWITGWYHLPCSILWSRSAYESTGGWDPRAYVNDDGDIMMRALADRIKLRITDKGASFYRRMPEGKESESLSGARFTREGREAQIYVIRKIAHRLEERGMLKSYRKPITLALSRLATLCQAASPDLSEYCQRLINRYGEPHYLRFARIANRRLRHGARIGLNRTQRLMSQVTNYVHTPGSYDDHQLPEIPEIPEEVEITYGMREFKKTAAKKVKGKLCEPSTPRVSIILPVSNRAMMTNRTLSSLTDQTFDDFEVLIVNTTSISAKHLLPTSGDSRFHVIDLPQHTCICAALNSGLRLVKGKFVAFIEPGMTWHPGKLEKTTQYFMQSSDDVGLVYSGVDVPGEPNDKLKSDSGMNADKYRSLLPGNSVQGCSSVVLRRTVIPVTGFFDVSLPSNEDHDYWVRVARDHETEYIGESLVLCHSNSDDVHSFSQIDDTTEGRLAFFEKHRKELRYMGVGREFLQETAQRELLQSGGSAYNRARRIALQALRENPFNNESYRFIYTRFLPDIQKAIPRVLGRENNPIGN